MSLGYSSIYILLQNKMIAVVETETLTVVKTQEITAFEPTTLVFSIVTDEIWVGDKKGIIHILNSEDFSEKATIEKKHNHSVNVMTVSRDGKLIASGDTYRYIYVFDTESKAEIGCYAYHTSKITHLNFSKDSTLLVTGAIDLNVGIVTLATKAKKIIESKSYYTLIIKTSIEPHQKDLTGAVFDDDNRVITSGYDCAVRIWSL